MTINVRYSAPTFQTVDMDVLHRSGAVTGRKERIFIRERLFEAKSANSGHWGSALAFRECRGTPHFFLITLYEMSAIHKSPSQIGAREKYLKALSTATEYTLSAEPAAIMTVSEWLDISSADTGDSGALYRDMGRRVRVVNADGLAIAEYTRAQIVNGIDTEGVPADASYGIVYIKTFDANSPSSVGVVRTG
jgi:hypothetical protein